MNVKTIWDKSKNNFSTVLENDTDILIIGAGITGITLSYLLSKSKQRIMLIDKGKILNGITSKTTAKISYLQGDVYQKIEKVFDRKIAKLYYDSQIEAILKIKEIIEKEKIECDLERVNSIIFTLNEGNKNKILKEKEILNSFNVKTFDVNNDKIIAGLGVNDTYQFNPIKYLDSILKVIKNRILICENICAMGINKDLDGYLIKTNKGNIKAKIVIVATHYPFFIKPLFLPLKAYVKREYVNAAKIINKGNYTAISIDKDLHSIRYYKDYILYGSNKHKITSKTDYANNYEKSVNDFKKYFNIEPQFTWMNQDIMSNDYLPFIGKLDNNLFVATAYNAWGMTNGTIASKMIYDLLVYGKSKYEKVFNPKRVNMELLCKTLVLISSYTKVYIGSIFKRNNPSYVKIKGIWYGVYVDDNNKIHKIKLVCPHMKCNLVFNRIEKTWDCPCHGSRFDLDGKLILGPAKKDLVKE